MWGHGAKDNKRGLKVFLCRTPSSAQKCMHIEKKRVLVLMKILQLFDSDNKGLEPIWNLAGLADLLQQLRYYTEF